MAFTGDILASTDYDMIRHLLDVTSTEVPDAIIEDFLYLPLCEAEVKEIVTDYATLTGANEYRLKAATAYWTAALLCPHMQELYAIGLTIGEYTEKATTTDYREKAQWLLDRARAAMAGVSTRTIGSITYFTLAGPKRSGHDIPSDYEALTELFQSRLMDWLEEDGEDD